MIDGLYGCLAKSFWLSTSNVIFVRSSQTAATKKEIEHACFILTTVRSPNNVFIHENGRQIELFSCDIFKRKVSQTPSIPDTDVLFPDRLKNLHQYKYKIVKDISDKNDNQSTIEMRFLEIVMQKQNASLVTTYSEFDRPELLSVDLFQAKIDICLDTENVAGLSHIQKHFKSVNTFETNGYCALVPMPPKTMFLKHISHSIK